jgi:hypothetical protein
MDEEDSEFDKELELLTTRKKTRGADKHVAKKQWSKKSHQKDTLVTVDEDGQNLTPLDPQQFTPQTPQNKN